MSQGKREEELKQSLLAGGGWEESDIDEAFSSIRAGFIKSHRFIRGELYDVVLFAMYREQMEKFSRFI
ncbi:MAG: hypothetical protein ACI88L_000384 [Candidatus Paceibacteria bacterium]|jgi:hypothetical protein